MKKFRKKPVVVEVIQYVKFEDYAKVVEWMKASGDTHALADEIQYRHPLILIQTLEGCMAASPGDYIIKGVKGEFYPCKPEIFEATYEPVD